MNSIVCKPKLFSLKFAKCKLIESVERVIGMGCLYIFERCLHSYLGRKRMVVSQVLMAGNLFIPLFIICERFRTVGERGRISDEVTQQCN